MCDNVHMHFQHLHSSVPLILAHWLYNRWFYPGSFYVMFRGTNRKIIQYIRKYRNAREQFYVA